MMHPLDPNFVRLRAPLPLNPPIRRDGGIGDIVRFISIDNIGMAPSPQPAASKRFLSGSIEPMYYWHSFQ